MNREQAEALARARQRAASASGQNADGSYGQPPEGYFQDPRTGGYTSREGMRQNIEPSRTRAAAGGYIQGYTLNTADEALGVVGGPAARERMRATMDVNREAFPWTTGGAEVAGNVMSPITKFFGPGRSVGGAAATGGTIAAADAAGRAEGGVGDRATEAAKGGITGLFFGSLTAGLGKGANAAVRRAFTKAERRPTIQALKDTKNAAYAAVRNAGEKFDGDEMTGLYQRVADLARQADFDDIADPQTAATLRILERRQGQEVSLDRLDRLRQSMWDRYSRSNEPLILDMIGEVDNLVAQRAGSSELMETARKANSLYAKSQLLDNAFRKARLQTAATGSGGNILNKYRQSVASILNNPKEAKWFSPEEVALMENFVEGEMGENVMRRIGKLSPGGNGLMTALNVYAASVDPTMLMVTGAATAAKGAADRSAMRGSEALLDAVSTGGAARVPPRPPLRDLAVGGAAAANQKRY